MYEKYIWKIQWKKYGIFQNTTKYIMFQKRLTKDLEILNKFVLNIRVKKEEENCHKRGSGFHI